MNQLKLTLYDEFGRVQGTQVMVPQSLGHSNLQYRTRSAIPIVAVIVDLLIEPTEDDPPCPI